MATSAEIRQQLVAPLRSDLIGPGWDDVARRHEQLSQPPSVWYTVLPAHAGMVRSTTAPARRTRMFSLHTRGWLYCLQPSAVLTGGVALP